MNQQLTMRQLTQQLTSEPYYYLQPATAKDMRHYGSSYHQHEHYFEGINHKKKQPVTFCLTPNIIWEKGIINYVITAQYN